MADGVNLSNPKVLLSFPRIRTNSVMKKKIIVSITGLYDKDYPGKTLLISDPLYNYGTFVKILWTEGYNKMTTQSNYIS